MRLTHGATRRGHKDHLLYRVWKSMIGRCYNSKDKSFRHYGGRGIRVCDRWRKSFEKFRDDMGVRPDRTEIDRINNDGNYEPGNCRWATRREQTRNTRTSRFLTVNGETLCVAAWAEKLGIRRETIHVRLMRGWSHERALTAPMRRT